MQSLALLRHLKGVITRSLALLCILKGVITQSFALLRLLKGVITQSLALLRLLKGVIMQSLALLRLLKFGRMVKKVKVNQGSSFEQTMIGQNPECYITIFIEISPLAPEKKIMEAFFCIYGCGGHLGNMTSIIFINFHFLITESFHKKNWFITTHWFLKKPSLNSLCK